MIELSTLSHASLWILSRFEFCQEQVRHSVKNLETAQAMDAIYRFLWDDYASWYVEFLKTDKQDLEFAKLLFGHFVSLLSPFAPFVAESLWTDFFQNSSTLAKLEMSEIIAELGELPKITLENQDMEKDGNAKNLTHNLILEFSDLVDFIREIRSVRGLFGIDPSFKLTMWTQNMNLKKYTKFLEHIAKSELKIEENVETQQLNPTQNQLFEIKISQFIAKIDLLAKITDPTKQIEKSQKELESLEKQIKVLKNQLNNENFTKNASPEIILDTQTNLAERQTDLLAQQNKIQFLTMVVK